VPQTIESAGGVPLVNRVGSRSSSTAWCGRRIVFGGEVSGPRLPSRAFSRPTRVFIPFLLRLELISKREAELSELLAASVSALHHRASETRRCRRGAQAGKDEGTTSVPKAVSPTRGLSVVRGGLAHIERPTGPTRNRCCVVNLERPPSLPD